MTTIEHDKTVAEQELISMLGQMRPVAIIIAPHTRVDGNKVYAWRAGESNGTHPSLLGAVQAALEDTMVSLAYMPVSPESQLTPSNFPPKLSPF